jgi:hypothetical protein
MSGPHHPLRPLGYLIGQPLGSPQVSSLKFRVRLAWAEWIEGGMLKLRGSGCPLGGGSERAELGGGDTGMGGRNGSGVTSTASAWSGAYCIPGDSTAGLGSMTSSSIQS